jgi:Flagellar capping protein
LVINETNLKKALANNPDKVAKLFTSDSDVSYYDTLENPSLRSQRNKETGIAQRFSDVIQDAIRTNTDSGGQKGSLLEKAGIVGDRSEYSNILAKEIMDYDNMATDMNSKLVDKQNALYSKFSKMETALSQLNSQQSWLAQQFGGGR